MDRTTEMLSSFACGLTYDDLTPSTVHQVKRVLVDTLACALGGYHSEPAEMVVKLARTVTSTLPSRILGAEYCSSPDMAGFANSVMVRYLDYNDIAVGGHPSDSIPGALAMADYLRSDGRSIINSIVVAYEVSRRVGDHVQHALPMGWDHGVLRSLGAACYPKGHPRNPMTDADIEAKFRSLSAGLLPAEQCDRALDLLWSIEEQPHLEELFNALVVQVPPRG